MVGPQIGSTALMLAVENGHTKCVQLLLDRGANKEAKDRVRTRTNLKIQFAYFVCSRCVVMLVTVLFELSYSVILSVASFAYICGLLS